jgi:hypothetical protein
MVDGYKKVHMEIFREEAGGVVPPPPTTNTKMDGLLLKKLNFSTFQPIEERVKGPTTRDLHI